jgi:hypothetical protein
MTAETAVGGGELVVWTPTDCEPEHMVHVAGLANVVQHRVEGGRIITATVTDPGTYALWIGEPDDPDATAVACESETTPTTSTPITTDPAMPVGVTTRPSGAAPATAVAPNFTG